MSDETAPKNDLAERLRDRFGVQIDELLVAHDEVTIVVNADNLIDVCTALRDEDAFLFKSFIDICGVDYLSYGKTEWNTADVTSTGFSRGTNAQAQGRFAWEERPREAVLEVENRFASVLHLLSLEHNERLRIRTYCHDQDYPLLPSVTSIWAGANWFERESYDLFGIIYEGHPDLRRILTDYGFIGHPFRKDFPLIGNVEVRYDPIAGRVIYEPVNSVVPRVTVPRVIRNDQDLEEAASEAADKWWEN